jgi:exonuclease VII large subunit
MARKEISPVPPQPTESVGEQIARLQQRQLEMVQQTAQELESLKHQLEKSDQVEKLQQEVERLKLERQALEKNLREVQQQFLSQQENATRTVAGLTGIIRTHLQQVEGFASQTEKYLGELPGPSALPTFTPVALPEPEAVVLPVEHTPLPALELPLQKTKKSRTFSGRKFALRTVSLGLIVAVGYAGWHQFGKGSVSSADAGEVAGASTVVTASPSPEPYAQSYVDLPFNQTVWDTANDSEFGLTFDYPKNTSNRVRTLGGNNLWVLRHNGYLMKISLIESQQTLDAWWQENQKTYADGLKTTKTTFKSMPALYVESKEKTMTSGSSYFIKRTTGIFQIWIKDEPATTDDGQRLTRMVDSLTFTN